MFVIALYRLGLSILPDVLWCGERKGEKDLAVNLANVYNTVWATF